MSDTSRIHRVGPHLVEIQEPDLCLTVWEGEITADQLRAVQALLGEMGGGAGPIFVLHDFSRLTTIPHATRKLAATAPVTSRFAGIFCWGASFHVRILAQMIERVVRILRPDAVPLLFFVSEEQARESLAGERPRLEAAYARGRGKAGRSSSRT